MKNNSVIHGLWIGTELSAVEILTIKSFLKFGHTFQLWAYDEIRNVPENCTVMDANAILNRDHIFRYKHTNAYGHGKGSYAGFSDIFRYKLLFEKGGIYVDMDITCLRPFDFNSEYVFRYHHKFGCVGNIMKCPAGAEVMDHCFKLAVEEVTEENKRWELPIEILNRGVQQFSLSGHIVSISNNDSWPVVAKLISGHQSIPDEWYAIHWMNEEWRRLKLDKSTVLPGSNLEEYLDRFGVDFKLLSGNDALAARVSLSRWYYMLVNLRHRILG